MRPSPGVAFFTSLIHLFDSDPYTSAVAKKQLKTLSFMYPGKLLVRDIKKSLETESRQPMILRTKYERKSKKKSQPLFQSPYKIPKTPRITFGTQPRF